MAGLVGGNPRSLRDDGRRRPPTVTGGLDFNIYRT